MGKLIKKYKLFLSLICFLFIIGVIYRQSTFFYVIVQGTSMEPAFHNNQIVCFTKDISNLSGGDIVVFNRNNETNIKRITAVPGDFYFESSDLRSLYFENFSIFSRDSGMIYMLKKNQYFVEGDNQNGSIDSRVFGPIDKKDILGKYSN